MIQVNEQFLTVNPYSRPAHKMATVRGLVIHYVGNPNTTAMANRNYFESLKSGTIIDNGEHRYASSQYIVGLQGEVIQCIPEDEVAYHAGATSYKDMVYERLEGSPNYYTLGIECCHLDASGKMSDATYNALVQLTAMLCKRYHLDPLTDLWRHYDITGKICHKWFVDNPLEWENFKKTVVNVIAGFNPTIIETTPSGPSIVTNSKSQNGLHIVDISDQVKTDKPKYSNTHKLDEAQHNPKDMKTINFKQDYVVVIRKKLYYAINRDDEEKYLRVYQVNNFLNIRTSHSVYGRPATCSVSIKGGERVVCAEQEDREQKGWESWQALLKGWVGDSNTTQDHTNWRVGSDNWSLPNAPGIDFKNLLKAREAKYGWRFAEKCDWEPMDEIYIFGKSRNEKYRTKDGDYQFLPLFFGYINTVSKTYQAGQGNGLVINIQAEDQLKLMQLSRVVNTPSKQPGVVSGGGIDIRWDFPQDSWGCFAINDDFLNTNNAENNIGYYAFTNVFAGSEPYKFINRLVLDAGIPEKYLTKRVERITKIPFVPKKASTSPGDLLNAETKSRLEVCTQAAEKLMVEFFADEEGNIVFKIPNYALGINRLKDNNMGYEFRQDIMNDTGPVWVDAKGNKVDISKLKKEIQEAADTGKQVEVPQIVQTNNNVIEYKVMLGDTLWSIAIRFYNDGTQWKKIHQDNQNIIGSNPNSIRPGQILKIYKTNAANSQDTKAANKVANETTKNDLQSTLNSKEIRLVQGKLLSEMTDNWIPAIQPEEIISFTLTDTDKEIYNMYEIMVETPIVDFTSYPQAVRRVVPDFNSIVRFGLRPHPGVVNTPLISNRQEAEIFGNLMIQQSMANRYSGTVNMIEDSAIRIGDPIRIHMYDEHPFKETGKFNNYKAQSVFYVVGIERSIDVKNVSYMSLSLKAGRMMGQESIFDVFMPLYKYYWEDIDTTDVNLTQDSLKIEASKEYTVTGKNDVNIDQIITNVLGVDNSNTESFTNLKLRIVKLNSSITSKTIFMQGQVIKIPVNV